MTTFTHIPYNDLPSGVAALQGNQTDPAPRHRADHPTLVLSAMTAVVMVVAYEVLDSASDENWMLSWLVLWAVAFGTLALLAGTARRVSFVMGTVLDRRASRLTARAAQWAHASPGQTVTSTTTFEVAAPAPTLDPREPALSFARLDALRKGSRFMRHI